MKRFTLIIALLASTGFLFGQVTFEKTYEIEDGNNGICVEQTLDNGYAVLTQEIEITIHNSLVKTDEFGNIVWINHQFNDYYLYPEAICLSPDSGYLATGGVSDYPLFKIAKLDKMGDTIWLKSDLFGSSSVYRASIIPTIDNQYVISASSGSGYSFVKINGDGDTLWSSHYIRDNIVKLMPSDNGDIVIGGTIMQPITDIFINRIDSLGNLKQSDTISTEMYLRSFCFSNDGGYVLTGRSNSEGVVFMKADSVGNVVWENSYNPGMNLYAAGHSICSTPDGNYIIAAEIDNLEGGYLIKINESGEIIWSNQYGDRLKDVKVTNDNGLIATGTKNGKVYLIKTNLDGLITSIDNEKKKNVLAISIFPNPVNEYVKLSGVFASRGALNICFYNPAGFCLKSWEFINHQTGQHEFTLDLSNIPPGIYFLSLRAGNETVTKKVVKL